MGTENIINTESILISTKIANNVAAENIDFDPVLIPHINTVLSTLYQLNVGPSNGFTISDSSTTWEEFMGEDPRLNLVKTYVHLKVRLLFDPPLQSAVMEAIQNAIKELEWRILVVADEPVV